MNRTLLACTLTLFAFAADGDVPTVESTALGQTVVVRGRLGQPLGQLMTIEGVEAGRDYRRSKGDVGEHLFRVIKVEGQTLQEPQVVRLRFGLFHTRPPGEGEKRTLRGYETGGFADIPQAALGETHGLLQTRGWHFETYFQVIK